MLMRLLAWLRDAYTRSVRHQCGRCGCGLGWQGVCPHCDGGDRRPRARLTLRPLVLAAVAVLVLAGPVLAQIDAPASVNAYVGRLGTVVAKVDADEVEYLVIGAAGEGAEAGDGVMDAFREYAEGEGKGKRTLRIRILGVRSGTGYVAIIAVKAGKPLVHLVTVHVKPSGPDPVPPPDPGPGPQPPPPPPDPPKPTGALWVVLINDQDADTPGLAAVVASEKFRGQLAGWGLKFKVYDKSAPAVRDKGYLAHTKEFPALLVIDKDGRVLSVARCPEGPDAAIEAVRKGAGK